MEELRAYIQKVMRETGLTEWQIEKRADGKVSDSYVKSIISGKAKSISVEKLNALAIGLGVDGVELYIIASGKGLPQKQEDPWPSAVLLNTLQEVINNPDLTAILKALLHLKPTKLKALRKQIESGKE